MNTVTVDNLTLNKDYAFSTVYQSLNLSAKYKSRAEDFVVQENIAVDFSGEGEHCWLSIKKRGCNTEWVAQQLARFCGVKKMAVSYAGLKDRHAVTTQWFSVQLPGMPTPDWAAFEAFCSTAEPEESVAVLECFRHSRKLQRGALKGNTFIITLRELSDTSDATFESLKQRCQAIAGEGVPNYYGLQRFGRDFNNLEQASRLFANPRLKLPRHKRSMYLSAARSWLFNHILSVRIDEHVWNKRIAGDVFMLDGKSACFKDEADSESLDARLAANEIHPTAVLWGEGERMVAAKAAELESQVIDQFPRYRDGLISARLKAQRRSCRVVPQQLECQRQGIDFVVSFSLPAGSYATSVLAEIISQLN